MAAQKTRSSKSPAQASVKMLRLAEAADRVGHSTSALRRAIRRGALVAYKPCGELRIPEHELEAWVEASKVVPVEPARPSRPGSVRASQASAASFRDRAKNARQR